MPDHPAVIAPARGDVLSFKELDRRSRKLAVFFGHLGLHIGDHIAIMLENHPWYFEICWAAMRSGLYFTPINWHLSVDEAAYIVNDCDARVFITSSTLGRIAQGLLGKTPKLEARLMLDGVVEGSSSYEEEVEATADLPLIQETKGTYMFYSSGTTGRPKGIKCELDMSPYGTPSSLDELPQSLYGFSDKVRYLCPAPLYNAAPIEGSILAEQMITLNSITR